MPDIVTGNVTVLYYIIMEQQLSRHFYPGIFTESQVIRRTGGHPVAVAVNLHVGYGLAVFNGGLADADGRLQVSLSPGLA